MTKKYFPVIAYLVAVMMLTSGCNYEPPYQRGYNEGYAAGIEAAGGDPAEIVKDQPPASEEASNTGKSHIASIVSSKKDETGDKAEAGDSGDNEAVETHEASASDAGEDQVEEQGEGGEEDAVEAEEEGGQEEGSQEEGSSEVLGEGQSPSGGIPSGRIIAAEAVNEALYSNPEVIDGLRQIYPDEMIFGEFVGDSETNLLHRVGSDHFNQLGYNTIVVFDGSMSLQDILNEGFFTKCDCIE